MMADDLFFPITAEHRQGHKIAVDESILLHRENGIVCSFKQRAVYQIFVRQFTFCPFLLADIARNADKSQDDIIRAA